ncbi:ATP-dependent sacrificial sulfur transferase LarE [Planctomycetes bacterium K23_9]|uniref:tRNA-specific 2-thiouridylase MnmA n=1 Tax=Stieleria marina TaxID=1930275 RepID=A0A517P0W8_9BACT|nr:tRNA-specific 2-thiouridylase MnmA [Planctomycetes bacterium K23_9]
MTLIEPIAQKLIQRIGQMGRVVVAFSGGVDSSVVAAAAQQADASSCTAVTAQSPSVASWQIDLAKRVASEIGIPHRLVQTHEGQLQQYVRNDQQRCFYCKQTLYQSLAAVAEASGDAIILSGTNSDDMGDYRPGIEAGRLANVQTPLADLGIDKHQVRQLAAHFGLSNHDVPASPCLASRIVYGVAVTPERLRRVELAEDWLREQGFSDCRVRVHENELARIEVPKPEMPRLLSPELALDLSSYLTEIGFQFLTIDLQGLRSGNLNQVLVSIGGNNP